VKSVTCRGAISLEAIFLFSVVADPDVAQIPNAKIVMHITKNSFKKRGDLRIPGFPADL
jgi:hypothetical protein